MIQNVEELQSDAEVDRFVDRNVEVLHDGQVGVKVVRAPYLVTALISPPIDGVRSTCCERCLEASELWTGVQTRRAESSLGADHRALSKVTGEYWVTVGHAVVESAESRGGIVVNHGGGKSSPPEGGSGN